MMWIFRLAMVVLLAIFAVADGAVATGTDSETQKAISKQRPDPKFPVKPGRPTKPSDDGANGIAMIGEAVKVGDVTFYLGLFRLGAQPGLWLFRDNEGLAVTDGDIALGPFKQVLAQQQALRRALQSPAFALATLPGSFSRWPDGEVPFSFDGDWFAHEIPNDLRGPIRDAMDTYEALTPVDFRPKTANDQSWVRFARTWDFAVCPNSSTSEVGRVNGPTTVYIQVTDCEKRSACDAGELEDSECEDFNRDDFAIEVSALHETGHALGFKHEHTRPDRDEFVEIDTDCINQNFISAGVALLGNYNISSGDYGSIGPYDFDSIMHYPSNVRRDEDGNVTCVTIAKQPEHREAGDELGLIGPNFELSREDVNALYHMYRRNNQTNEAGDRFGHRLLAHDFDRDGYADLAVAALFERDGQGPNSGAVMLYKGTASGYVFWKRLDAPVPEAAQRFGMALAAADFDLDGTEDLAVGAPGTTVAGKDDAGAVFIFSIAPNLDADLRRTLIAPDGGEAHDRFGQALAVGRFFKVTQYPGEEQRERRRLHLAIGAPGARPPNTAWRPGYVWFWNEATPDAFGWPDIDKSQLPWAGGFGDSLVSLESEGFGWMSQAANDQRRTALLGSARFDDGLDCAQAAVFVLDGEPGGPGVELAGRIADPDAVPVSPSLCGIARTDPVAEGTFLPVVERGFGRALAVGDFDGDGLAEVAVGDPEAGYSPTAAGPGYVYLFDRDGASGSFALRQRIDQAAIGTNEPGDAFGAALTAADFDGDGLDDLAVGAPGDDIGEASNAGAVFFYRGCQPFAARRLTADDLRVAVGGRLDPIVASRLLFCGGVLQAWQSHNQPGDSDEADDFYGFALAATDVDADGDLDVIVGTVGEAPGGDPHSGYLHFLKSDGGSTPDSFASRAGFSQETESPFF